MTDLLPAGGAGWTYWVAYAHRGGYGATAVQVPGPLDSAQRVGDLQEQLAAGGELPELVITSWQLLSPPAERLAGPATTVPVAPVEVTGPPERVALIQGLRELADVLAANPDLPMPNSGAYLGWYPDREAPELDEAAVVAMIDRAAEILGVEVRDRLGHGQYGVHRYFGPVEYFAQYISAEYKAAYQARQREAGTGAGGER